MLSDTLKLNYIIGTCSVLVPVCAVQVGAKDRKSAGDAWDCLEFYLKETTGSLESLWPLLLEQSKAVKRLQ